MQVVAYASVNDVGRVVNPMIVRGQLDGGAVQGIGQALCEQMVYDREAASRDRQPDGLRAPRADIVACDFRTEMNPMPCKNNPLGVKGVGELGTIGATPACECGGRCAGARRRAAAAPNSCRCRRPRSASGRRCRPGADRVASRRRRTTGLP